jgi:hypothetical protein
VPAAVEAVLSELRMQHPSWGPRRLVFKLAKGWVVDPQAAEREFERVRSALDEAGGRAGRPLTLSPG